eukprot:UN24969
MEEEVNVQQVLESLNEQQKSDVIELRKLKQNRILERNIVNQIQELTKGANIIGQMLHSQTKTDVEHAIRFFERADVYDLPAAKQGFQKMLPIVMDKDNPKLVEAVLVAFHTRYFPDDGQPLNIDSKKAAEIAVKLCEMLTDIDLATLTSMEKLMYLWTKQPNKVDKSKNEGGSQLSEKKPVLPRDIFKALWWCFENAQEHNLSVDSKVLEANAVKLLHMGGCAMPGIIKHKIETLINKGLTSADRNPNLFLFTMDALVLVGEDIKKSPQLSSTVHDIVRKFLLGAIPISSMWYSVADSCIALIYGSSKEPVHFMQDIIKVFQTDMRKEESDETRQIKHPKKDCLAKFFNICGSTALRTLRYVELLETQMKSAKQERDEARSQREQKDKKEDDDDLEKAMGGQGQAEEFRIEQIRIQAEKSILGKDSLLFQFVKPLERVLTSTNMWKFKTLFTQSLLCWCKFMVVDKEFCRKQLPRLFQLFNFTDEKTAEPLMRASDKSNIIVALGDMCCRFPNELDGYLDKIYQMLHSKENDVRKSH